MILEAALARENARRDRQVVLNFCLGGRIVTARARDVSS